MFASNDPAPRQRPSGAKPTVDAKPGLLDARPSPPEKPVDKFWDLKASHWAQVLLTLGLLTVAFLQYEVYKGQSTIMQNQLAESQIENRPWIAPSTAGINAQNPAFVVVYGNTGKEPATDVMYSVEPIGLYDAPLAFNLRAIHAVDVFDTNCESFGTDIIRVGTLYPSTTGNYELSAPQPVGFAASAVPDKQVYIVAGCFVYATGGKQHHSTFCYYWGKGTGLPLTQWSICPMGNDAN